MKKVIQVFSVFFSISSPLTFAQSDALRALRAEVAALGEIRRQLLIERGTLADRLRGLQGQLTECQGGPSTNRRRVTGSCETGPRYERLPFDSVSGVLDPIRDSRGVIWSRVAGFNTNGALVSSVQALPMTYAEAYRYCQDRGTSLPTREIMEGFRTDFVGAGCGTLSRAEPPFLGTFVNANEFWIDRGPASGGEAPIYSLDWNNFQTRSASERRSVICIAE